ncbi:hypothetical protein L596_000065 [Steinernema carpocapsae]|uniref:Uncharacterized protein n=1 Tax=Steinernema carpocapsae TaxID=34508 RepID=A0A4U8UGP5_STECR|nr:hypothetical protein L596_000065 [Steinernema carpocapsae]
MFYDMRQVVNQKTCPKVDHMSPKAHVRTYDQISLSLKCVLTCLRVFSLALRGEPSFRQVIYGLISLGRFSICPVPHFTWP